MKREVQNMSVWLNWVAPSIAHHMDRQRKIVCVCVSVCVCAHTRAPNPQAHTHKHTQTHANTHKQKYQKYCMPGMAASFSWETHRA